MRQRGAVRGSPRLTRVRVVAAFGADFLRDEGGQPGRGVVQTARGQEFADLLLEDGSVVANLKSGKLYAFVFFIDRVKN